MTKLFFSEYIDGDNLDVDNDNFDQVLEIYNGTGAEVDLTEYSIRAFRGGDPRQVDAFDLNSGADNNGSPLVNVVTDLTLADGDVLVITNQYANQDLQNQADVILNYSPFDGNDVVALIKGNTFIDVIGQLGDDPGAGGWSGNGVSTDGQTLRRKATTLTGDRNPADPFDPSLQWESFANTDFTDLGSYTGGNRAPTLTGNATLTAIATDAVTNRGNSVAELLANLVTDPDFNPQGMAITGVDNTNGTWQYSTDGGANWQAIVGVSENNALTLLGETPLYVGDGTAPATQGWLALASVLFATPPTLPNTETVAANGITINTTANNDIYAGYSNFSLNPTTQEYLPVNPLFPTLDNDAGYAISFDLQVLQETVEPNRDRAGFSLIAVSQDASQAIELAFQDEQIFAQTLNGTEFVAGEAIAFDTTQATQFTLEVQGSTYDLLANGNSILTGNLRDYTAGDTGNAPDPYGVSNFLFLGDNTTSAQGEFFLGDVSLNMASRIRFVPDADFDDDDDDDDTDKATFQFRAWDTTDGSGNGQTGVDASQTGGTNAFSTLLGTGAIALDIDDDDDDDDDNDDDDNGSSSGSSSDTPAGDSSSTPLIPVFNFEQWVSFKAISTGVVFQSSLVDFNVTIGGLRIATLFDESAYLNANPDVAAAVQGGVFNYGFEHFVLFGLNEGRSPGSWFDEDYYLAQNADVAAAVKGGTMPSALFHFFFFGHRERRNPSQFFDADDYLLKNPEAQAAIAIGQFDSPFEHYCELGSEENSDSGLLFQESFYLQQNPDVAAAVKSGAFALGLYHFLYFGQREGRDPSSLFDQSAYLERYSDVAAAVAGGAFASAFEHYLYFGRAEGRIAV